MSKRCLLIGCIVWACLLPATAREYADSAIYQGISLKIDLATPVLEVARSKGKTQSYEIAMNLRLAQRWYPTLELGYALSDCTADGGHYAGQGGFGRIGLDLSALKKGVSENCLMVGFRVGTACQTYDLTNLLRYSDYWGNGTLSYQHQTRWDAWGELVAGCQVQVWKGLQMGWYVRFKILFTRTDKQGGALPYYMPGYGFRQDTNWGLNYYIGYKF